MASVVIHKYLKTSGQGVATAKAHVRYIQHRKRDKERERPDDGEKKSKGRELFDDERDSVDRREINRLIDSQNGNVAIHKLTLSPGLNGADLKEYTREIMDELGKAKGLDLQWAAAAHKNTDHDHVHVVVIGTDKNGRKVELRKVDHDLLRELSDRYLEREHNYDRELSREGRDAERLVKSWREPEQEREEIQERVGSLFGKGQEFEFDRAERIAEAHEKPITIGFGESGDKADSFYKTDDLDTLRELAHDYVTGSSGYALSLGWDQYERLKDWIEERESQLEREPQGKEWDRGSAKEADLERETSISIGFGEPGGDGQVDSYYKTDDLERLKGLASDYESGSSGYALSLGWEQYERLKDWIEERERQPERESQGKERDRESAKEADRELETPINVGFGEPGDKVDSYYKTDDLERLKGLASDYEAGSSGYALSLGWEQYERLNGWIEERERQPEREPQGKEWDRETGTERDKDREKPISIGFGEPGDKVDSYHKTDDLERLKGLASDYESGSSGYALSLGWEQYERLKGWIEERDRQPERETKGDGWSKEKAVDALPEREKITVQEKVYTKYDTAEDLKGLNDHLKTHYEDRLEKAQYAQLRRWIETKERDGDDCFEKWERERYLLAEQSKESSKKRLKEAQRDRARDQEKDKPRERDSERGSKQGFEVNRQWQEFDTSGRTKKAYEDRSGHIYRRMPRQQRMYEARGRNLEHHAIYMNSMAMHSLREARERTQDPKVLQYIEKELASLKAYGQELAKELPPINLDRLYGKDAERGRGRNREPDRPLDLKNIAFPDAVEEGSKKGIESIFGKTKGREKEVAGMSEKGDKNTDQREREDKGPVKEISADAAADSTASNEQKLQKEQEQAREAQSKLAQEQNRQMSEKAEKSVSETLEQKIAKPKTDDRGGGRERDER